MKSLDKDRTRRYETANAFADDVSRFLDDEPVLARPQSKGYRLQKFFRKNRALVISGLTVATLLLASACISYWFMLDARTQRNVAQQNEKEADQQRNKAEKQTELAMQKTKEADEKSKLAIAERNRADSEREVAEEVRRFLQDSLIRNISVWERANMVGDGAIAGDNITVRELLDAAATKYSPETIEKAFPNRPRVQSEILLTIANAYRSIDQSDTSVKFALASAQVSEQHFGDTSPEFVEGQGHVFFTSVAARDFARALKSSEAGFAGITRIYQLAKDADSIEDRELRLKEANEVMDQFINDWFEQMDPTRFSFPIIDSNEVDFATKALILPAALACRNLSGIVHELNGPEHNRAKFTSMFRAFFDYVIGFGMNQKSLVDKSIGELRDAVEWADQWPSDRQFVRALVQTAVAVTMDTHDVEPEEALKLFETGYLKMKQSLRKDHPATAIFGVLVAMAYKKREQYRKSFDLLTEALPQITIQLGAYPAATDIFVSVAVPLKEEEAMMQTLQEAHRRCRKIYGLSFRSYAVYRLQSRAAVQMNDREKAIAILREAFTEAKEKLGDDAEVTLISSIDLALTLYQQREYEAAVAQLQCNLGIDGELLLSDEAAADLTNNILANAHFRLGNFKSAIPHYRKLLKALVAGDKRLLSSKMHLVECLMFESEFHKAIPEARELVRLSGGGLFGSDSPKRPTYQQLLAKVYSRSGDNQKALQVLLPLLKSETAKYGKDRKNRKFLASLHLDAGSCYRRDKQAKEAALHLKKSISLLEETESPDRVVLALARVQLGALMLDSDSDNYEEVASLLLPAWDILSSRTNEPPFVQWQGDAKKSATELIRLYTATGETEKLEQVRKKIEEILASRKVKQ